MTATLLIMSSCQGFSPVLPILRHPANYNIKSGISLIRTNLAHPPSSSMFLMEKEHVIHQLRGGALRGHVVASVGANDTTNTLVQQLLSSLLSTPSTLFRTLLVSILSVAFVLKLLDYTSKPKTSTSEIITPQQEEEETEEKKKMKELQFRFLPVFWMLRLADWLQGPYFYEVYASKALLGASSSSSSSLTIISQLFLTGFASTALFGPVSGQLVDTYGRKKGTLAFCLFYMLGALSTKSNTLLLLLLGRVASGIGTSLLFSAPESWLVGDAQRIGQEKALGGTFGLAYAGDSIVAITAGQLASLAASKRGGPTGPFELSIVVLAFGAFLTSMLWKENVGSSSSEKKQQPTIQDALRMVVNNPKIAYVGAVQSLFEAAMYIFVLQWPPAIASAIAAVYGSAVTVPYGTIFSCFMACCLMGATLFSKFNNKISNIAPTRITTESTVTVMLLLSTIAVGISAAATSQSLSFFQNSKTVLSALVAAFFAFEMAVGFYFPSIGTLRSKHIPDSHRSVIMNLFGIPLNALVVSVFLSIQSLGVGGALSIATGALGIATISMFKLLLQTKSSPLETTNT